MELKGAGEGWNISRKNSKFKVVGRALCLPSTNLELIANLNAALCYRLIDDMEVKGNI